MYVNLTILTNAGGCSCVYISIQFKSRVLKAPENRSSFSKGYYASLLDF